MAYRRIQTPTWSRRLESRQAARLPRCRTLPVVQQHPPWGARPRALRPIFRVDAASCLLLQVQRDTDTENEPRNRPRSWKRAAEPAAQRRDARSGERTAQRGTLTSGLNPSQAVGSASADTWSRQEWRGSRRNRFLDITKRTRSLVY